MLPLYRDALDLGDYVVAEWRPIDMRSFTVARTSTTNGTKSTEQS
ncbi:hypothetical protein ACLK19_05045 [Escherichia coli]